jgi:hypothetical protein
VVEKTLVALMRTWVLNQWVGINLNQRRTPAKKGGLWLLSIRLLAAVKNSMSGKVVTWLILPVVICLSQRLSHACLSINNFVL